MREAEEEQEELKRASESRLETIMRLREALEEENREMQEAAREYPELMKAVQANNREILSSLRKRLRPQSCGGKPTTSRSWKRI